VKPLVDRQEADNLSMSIFGQTLPTGNVELGLWTGAVLVGFVTGQALFEEAELYYLALAPHVRRQGLGKQLLAAFFETCRSKGVEAIFLEVREGNVSAISLYEKSGFEPMGQRKNYYPDGENAVLMRRSLV